MKCPKCGSEQLKVNEKRDLDGEGAIRRRRECISCSFRFTTYERIEVPSLVVTKKDGTKQSYNREKLAAGFYKALEKRPFTESEIEQFIDETERTLNSKAKEEITTQEIGDIVSATLRKVDEVAYLRFVSVYKSFQDAESFAKELKSLSKNIN